MPEARSPAAVPLALALALGGCGVRLGVSGDDAPLTSYGTTLRSTPIRPAWRKVLNEGAIYRGKPVERVEQANLTLTLEGREGRNELVQALRDPGVRAWLDTQPELSAQIAQELAGLLSAPELSGREGEGEKRGDDAEEVAGHALDRGEQDPAGELLLDTHCSVAFSRQSHSRPPRRQT